MIAMRSTEHLHIEDLEFTVRRSERRTSIGITLERDGSLILSAPTACPHQRMESAVRSRLFWIYSKQALRSQSSRREVPRAFTSGESYAYLGKRYRLWVQEGDGDAVSLRDGRLVLRADVQAKAHDHLHRWYQGRGLAWLPPLVERWAPRLGVKSAGIAVRDLGHRWGSCTDKGRLLFHWQTMTLPPSIIEYVVVHELVHLTHSNHTSAFWSLVSRVMGDYEQRKRWLAEQGGGYLL